MSSLPRRWLNRIAAAPRSCRWCSGMGFDDFYSRCSGCNGTQDQVRRRDIRIEEWSSYESTRIGERYHGTRR
jgi:DnaJ-class molecular chaperone